MDDSFDADELARLVAEALATERSAPRPEGAIPLAFGSGRILERLSEVLSSYLEPADIAMVLDTLRTELYDGVHRESLRDIHTIVKYCRKCPSVRPDPQLPVWNLADPDVVFVGDLPWGGTASDAHLAQTLRTVGFTSRRVAYTSLVRCLPAESRGPNATEVSTCASRFLFTELQILAPKLIVTLGGPATATLVGTAVKITEERGRIFWIGPWPILATYSPAYVLRGKGEREFSGDLAKAYEFAYGVNDERRGL